jgi:hypothetical protein
VIFLQFFDGASPVHAAAIFLPKWALPQEVDFPKFKVIRSNEVMQLSSQIQVDAFYRLEIATGILNQATGLRSM